MSDYYRDEERREHRGDDRPDFYSHEGGRDRGEHHEKKDDHEILGTLGGAIAGGLGGHALGGKSGHGVAGGILGAVAGAFVGHEAEEKIDDWKENREEKKYEEERRERDEERREREEDRREHDFEERRRREDEERRREDEFRHQGPPPPRGDFIEVTVQPGDTLRGIAARFDHCSFEDIARHNNIANPDLIYPGQVLQVPARRF